MVDGYDTCFALLGNNAPITSTAQHGNNEGAALMTSGSGQMGTKDDGSDGFIIPINGDTNQDTRNMKHFDAPVNEIDVENLGASGSSPEDGVDEDKVKNNKRSNSTNNSNDTKVSEPPELNLTNVHPQQVRNIFQLQETSKQALYPVTFLVK